MHAVGGHARSRQAARQLRREQDVGQLRPGVRAHDGVAALEPQVVEVDRSPAMADRGHRDHACGRAAHDEVEEQVGQEEVAEVVHGEGGLDPVPGQAAGLVDAARIVDEHVEAIGPRAHALGQGADVRLGGEVADQVPDLARAAPGGHVTGGGRGPHGIASDHEQPRA